jgi:hypothetical protein
MNRNTLAFSITILLLMSLTCGLTWAEEPSLAWSTFLGGNSYEVAHALALDSLANPVLAGWTLSSDFPTTPGAYDRTFNGNHDVFVAALSASGSALLWSTFLGGSSYEDAHTLALDSLGNPVLAGRTLSSDFPTTPGAYDRTYNGNHDVFVAILSASGSALLWSTFLGGSEGDSVCGLVLDSSGNPVVAGYTLSSDFPKTPGAYDQTYNGAEDVFVSRLSASGDALLWSTFLGGSGSDVGSDLALDSLENPVVMGYTLSSDFPKTPGAYDQTYNGSHDVFVSRLSASGSALLWSTFLGGGGSDVGSALALDSSGSPVVMGYTLSSDFPKTPGAYDQTYNGAEDVFISRLSASGDALLWSTFLGGSGSDVGSGLALNPSGNAVVTGYTLSSDFPKTPGAYDQTYNGAEDVFVSRLSASGDALLWSTFLGGSGSDVGSALALDPSGNAVVTGYTLSSDFPKTPGAYDQTYNGGHDVFVTKFAIGTGVESRNHVIGLPRTFELNQNYPNPFNASTEIRYQIPQDSYVTLKIFSILGQEVRVLADGQQEHGSYAVIWDGCDNRGQEVASGVYFCRLKMGDIHKTVKMAYIR